MGSTTSELAAARELSRYQRTRVLQDRLERTRPLGEQNGDVEAGNGAHKHRIEQALLVRGSRDFESAEAYQLFLDGIARKANAGRGPRVGELLRKYEDTTLFAWMKAANPNPSWHHSTGSSRSFELG